MSDGKKKWGLWTWVLILGEIAIVLLVLRWFLMQDRGGDEARTPAPAEQAAVAPAGESVPVGGASGSTRPGRGTQRKAGRERTVRRMRSRAQTRSRKSPTPRPRNLPVSTLSGSTRQAMP